MMKKFLYIVCFVLIFACNNEDASDCFQTTGTTIQNEIEVAAFDKILIYEGVELIVKEGAEQKVVIETGRNLLNDVTAVVSNNELILTDNNSCNFFRDYNITKVYVTSPNITEIRNSSQFPVRSDGTLTYPNLTVYIEDYFGDYLNTGDCFLSINNEELRVISNGNGNFYIDGNTNSLSITFAAGDSRFEGQNLRANKVFFTHKSTNDMLVYPIDIIRGSIYSYGDVIAYNQPTTVNVEELFQGKLIFR
ncbi:hypothetical protein KH5_06380 [Urechidicola sp. KH5]